MQRRDLCKWTVAAGLTGLTNAQAAAPGEAEALPAAGVAELGRRSRSDAALVARLRAAGYPHVTVPAGHVGQLPVGLSFVGTAWSEAGLMSMAFDFELASRARRPPQFALSQG